VSDLFADLVPPNVEKIAPYEPGKPISELERELGISGAIKLASNENPLGPSPKAVAAAQAALQDLNLYPDGGGHRLRHDLAAHLGVGPDEVALGAGSNELIDLFVRAFCHPGVDEVLTHQYAFVMYRISCQAHGVAFREAPVGSDLACDVDALASAIGPRTKLMFLPNPNNPTGSYVGRAAFERLLARVPRRVILVVDEAYHEYATMKPDYPSAESYRSEDRPLIVTLRTFSKIYGLAGLRVGYGIADKRIVGYLNRVRMPFNVSSPAQAAASAALGDVDHVERSRRGARAAAGGADEARAARLSERGELRARRSRTRRGAGVRGAARERRDHASAASVGARAPPSHLGRHRRGERARAGRSRAGARRWRG
jgi:histidinol-phosphate aminotransferase